ncbi:type II toxin-antitoxin system Phd/YefM family antitoxin [Streptomyces sp. H27-D2]|uniref:type II toxin-antitoxin system Phd/YefM family antitoxin n=1 Tax=Streptomyces sp. H27-D2 TaxID=3046304 RepID=UPI002DBCCC59|nr:type II toxin-antitoxin system prevent-host-death family antitoxin [Streptomyces sp. H27-D2]MEC4016434.1 type II toxin-antitoxin system prevent-host-death family antitoxin [Streptomyces sp. H27-D2]
METATAREFNQQSAKILAAAEQGRPIAVTKNGRHIATLVPVGQAEPVPAFPTDAMGDEDDLPLLDGPADLSARTEEFLAGGFGE